MLVPNYFYAPNTIERKSTGLKQQHEMLLTYNFMLNSCSQEGATRLSTFSAFWQFCLLFALKIFTLRLYHY